MKENLNITAAGAVLPATPGTIPLAADSAVTIDGFDESGLIRCIYPDGFVKHHQADSVEELAVKVANQLKARHGVSDVPFASAPKALKAGETFTVKG